VGNSLANLKAAQDTYPFLPRFREGMGVRLKIYATQGKCVVDRYGECGFVRPDTGSVTPIE